MAQLLLATNLSPSSGRAVDRVNLIASLPGYELYLLYVLPKDKCRPDKHVLREIDRARSKLQTEFKTASDNAGQKVEMVAVHGYSQSEIVACAKRCKASLVVMANTRDFSMSNLFGGTLADRVIFEADCPVLIVHRRTKSPYQKVLLPFNNTLACYAAFETAFELAPDAQFTVLYAETDRKTDEAGLHDKKGKV